jgi:2-phospho-L-lactate transferase/gluconeogenesis factor (CofD/UPF0052 family)
VAAPDWYEQYDNGSLKMPYNRGPEAFQQEIVGLTTISDDGGGTRDQINALSKIPDIHLPAVGDLRNYMVGAAPKPQSECFEKRFGPGIVVADVLKMRDELFSMMRTEQFVNDQVGLDPSALLDDAGFTEVVSRVEKERNNLANQTLGGLMLAHTVAAPELGGLGWGLGDSVQAMSQWLGIAPNVTIMPVTEVPNELRMNDSGRIVVGESNIDDVGERHKIWDPRLAEMSVHAKVKGARVAMFGPAYESGRSSDAMVWLPSSSLTSLKPIATNPGMDRAVAGARLLVHVVKPTGDGGSFMGKKGRHMTGNEEVESMAATTGRFPDVVVVNNDSSLIPDGKYRPSVNDDALRRQAEARGLKKFAIYRAPILRERTFSPHDVLAQQGKRSKVATNGRVVARLVNHAIALRQRDLL